MMRNIMRMNIEEMAYNVGHTCGSLNMRLAHVTILAYEFRETELILKCLDGYNEALAKMCNMS
jgi:hypothetical protein